MKKFVVVLLACACICTMSYSPVSAKDSDDGIVTAETYQPVSKDSYKNYKDAEMNSSNEESQLEREESDGSDNGIATYSGLTRAASGPYWTTSGGVKSFYDANGTLMGSKKIIDVSSHQGQINWNNVKADGIDGAILRVGWGYLGQDEQFARNVSECNRLGIPYGVYLYSYAYDANFAYAEANGTAEMLSKVKLNLSYPIYYDIENFTPWKDGSVTRKPPTTSAQYASVISTYINRMNQLGYSGKVHVYSYRSYLQNQLNTSSILQYVSWTAAYTSTLGYTNKYYKGISGWQYTSTGRVNGVSGDVDISCFRDQMYQSSVTVSVPNAVSNKLSASGMRLNNGYVTGVTYGGNISSVANTLSSLGNVVCYNSLGRVITSERLATGQRIAVTMHNGQSLETYTMNIVVKGDVDGDGQIYARDYVKIKNHIMGNGTLSGASLLAADINNDGKVYATDYVKIKNYIMGNGSIAQ